MVPGEPEMRALALILLALPAWADPSPYVPQYPPNAPIVQRPYLPGGEWRQVEPDRERYPAAPVPSPTWTLTPGYLAEPAPADPQP